MASIDPSSYSYIFGFLSRNKYIILILIKVTYIDVHILTWFIELEMVPVLLFRAHLKAFKDVAVTVESDRCNDLLLL